MYKYCKNIESYKIIKHNNVVKSVSDVFLNINLVIDLVKDDVIKISKSQNLYFSDFDYFYNISSKNLKSKLSKTHLPGTKRILSSKNVEEVIKMIQSRILNDMKNLSTNPKYKNFIDIKIIDYFEVAEEINNEYETMLMLEDFKRIDTNTLISGLKKVWNDLKYDSDFDTQDLLELCNKFNMEVKDVIEIEEFEQEKFGCEQTESGNFQLVLNF